ncbi:ubiquitin-related domain-containing protein, partial [Fusarium solani]
RTPGGFTIFVVSMSGKRVALEEMSSSDTVKNLRSRIQEEEGTPIHKQRIVFNGHQLEDERCICDYNIGKGDTVHLVLQLSGGGYSIMSTLSDLSGTENAEAS